MQAVRLASSIITHTRHGTPSHFLSRSGLSILIDLDHLVLANTQSRFFSIDKFNLISFYQSDYGTDYLDKQKCKKQGATPDKLARNIRNIAHEYLPNTQIQNIFLLTFPRIFNLNFNPISVFICQDIDGNDRFVIYEVHNTFGNRHYYITKYSSKNEVAKKIFHVSPFFKIEGDYEFETKLINNSLKVEIKYYKKENNKNINLLNALFYGKKSELSNKNLIVYFFIYPLMTIKVIYSIHLQAFFLWKKGIKFIKKPKLSKTIISLSNSLIKNDKK